MRINNIDRSISNQLVAPFHATAAGIGSTYFEKRIYELVTKICARIIDSAGRRIPYICGHAEYMQLCEEICRNISPSQYTPDYESFRQAFVQSDLTEEMLQSRECRQLRYCNLTTTEISDHLSYEQYYENIRQHYLRDAQKEKILSTERIANQNHKDVVLELQADGRDKPSLRLVKTKRAGISTMPNEFSRWGAYIFLIKINFQTKFLGKMKMENPMSNETESILDLQIEVIQASIYCDIIKRLLLQHRSVSIVKVIVFSFIIKKQQYLQKNIYTGRNRDDLVLKFLSQASGLFDELCEQMPYIFQSIDLLVKDDFCVVHEGELICNSIHKQGLSGFDTFTNSVIQESKIYSDRQFLKEVISIV